MPRRIIVFMLIGGLGLACAPAPTPPLSDVLELEPNGWRPPAEPESSAERGPGSSSVEPASGEGSPRSAVMAQRVYTPDPSKQALAQTKAAREKKNGRAVVGFCVTRSGAISDIHMIEPYPDDPEIDQILMNTIARWRFKPFMVDHRPVKTCTERTFNIRFHP